MKKYIKILKIILTILIIFGISYFFITQFSLNWNHIKDMNLSFSPFWITLSFVFMVAFYLLTTYNWQLLINSNESVEKLDFKTGFAITNISGLTKYLPGKVWAYAIQMFILKGKGFRPSLVLFDNIVLLVFAISTPVIIGVEMFITLLPQIKLYCKIIISILILLIYLIYIINFPQIIKITIKVVNKLFKRTIEYNSIDNRKVYTIQLYTILEYIMWIFSIALICPGIYLDLSLSESLYVGVLALLSTIIGFIALVTPGGLGVQEAVLYGFISTRFSKEIALIIPLVIRVIGMFVDIILAVIATFLGRKDIMRYYNSKRGICDDRKDQ